MEQYALAATGYLIHAIKENKELNKFGNDFLGALVRWVRPLFLKDDKVTEKDALLELKAAPDDKLNQEAVTIEIKKHLARNPELLEQLEPLLKQLQESKIAPNVTQIHFGTGDNVAGNKTTIGRQINQGNNSTYNEGK